MRRPRERAMVVAFPGDLEALRFQQLVVGAGRVLVGGGGQKNAGGVAHES